MGSVVVFGTVLIALLDDGFFEWGLLALLYFSYLELPTHIPCKHCAVGGSGSTLRRWLATPKRDFSTIQNATFGKNANIANIL